MLPVQTVCCTAKRFYVDFAVNARRFFSSTKNENALKLWQTWNEVQTNKFDFHGRTSFFVRM